MVWISILGGLALLVFGGETLLRGAIDLARRFRIPEILVGVILMGFGTSLPELVTSLQAVYENAPGIAVGNVMGSNVANTLLVLGVVALIMPIRQDIHTIKRDSIAMVLSTALFVFLVLDDGFSRIAGGLLVIALTGYLFWSISADIDENSHKIGAESNNLFLSIAMAAMGIAMVAVGAHFLIDGAVSLAETLGISHAVIGLTIIAIGTSLPELATAGIAAFRGKSDLAIGNVIGSNIFNILGIMGVTALALPFRIPFEEFDIMRDLAMLPLSLAIVGLMLAIFGKIGRIGGLALLLVYAGYIAHISIMGS